MCLKASATITIFRNLMSFFKTLDTKLKVVITCNTGFKEILHLHNHWFKKQITT